MRRPLFSIVTVSVLILLASVSTARAQVPADCRIGADTVAGIRQMLTAEDNGLFFEIWTSEELACACIEIYYNDPPDAFMHDRVVTGAVVLLGQTGDPRAVPVLIDAIDTHPAQALYNLSNFPTVDALNALVAHIRDENDEARENAAEGLRNMRVPSSDEIEEGWGDALEAALDEVGDWMIEEPVPDIRDYFLDDHANLESLLEAATAAAGAVD